MACALRLFGLAVEVAAAMKFELNHVGLAYNCLSIQRRILMSRLSSAASWTSLSISMALAVLSLLVAADKVFATSPTCDECENNCQYCQDDPDPTSCFQQCMNTCNPNCLSDQNFLKEQCPLDSSRTGCDSPGKMCWQGPNAGTCQIPLSGVGCTCM